MSSDDSHKPEFALSEIDDKEFEIPFVENVPSLESILESREDESITIDSGDESHGFAEASPGHAHQLFSENTSETSSLSSNTDCLVSSKQKAGRIVQYSKHGAILRNVCLKSLSAQLVSAADRIDAGTPSCLSVSSFLAVGTTHGIVMMFDAEQALVWCLGGAAGIGTEYGAVTALSINDDCTRLLAGHACGHIIMWDLTTGKVLRTVANIHSPGASVLHVKFTADRNVALSNDSGGSVFAIEFKRLIGVRSYDANCLFSGSRGQVCCVEPLIVENSSLAVNEALFFAMASLRRVVIVSLRPELRIHYKHQLHGSSATYPLLAWKIISMRLSPTRCSLDPVLAFARGSAVYFVQVSYRGVDDIQVAPLHEISVTYKLWSIAWIDRRTMLFIDTDELAHVIDVRSEEELEILDFCEHDIVSSSAVYKSSVNDVTKSSSKECPCYHAVVSYGDQLFVLGSTSVQVMTLRTWSDRIAMLTSRHQYQAALTLAQSFLDRFARTAVGLSGSAEKRRQQIYDCVVDVLIQYVDFASSRISNLRQAKSDQSKFFQVVVINCIDFTLLINRTDLLFNYIYDRFSEDDVTKAVFLECLEPYILNDSLRTISPAVMKDFVNHYEKCGALAAVEACITHMDIATLDIHQVVSLCWTWNLYDAIIYIYNQGMADYVTPLQQLLAVLKTAIERGARIPEAKVQLGNKILVYVSCCLAGRAYPLGDIPTELVAKARTDVLSFITSQCVAPHSSHNRGKLTYPHMWTLLQFDAREFFNVLTLSFEDETCIEPATKQQVVNILLQLMTENLGFTSQQISALFTFLARQMARHNNGFSINNSLFEQVLVSLCTPHADPVNRGDESSHHEERQQALLELLATPALDTFDENRLLALAESAKFYRVVERVCLGRRQYDTVLTCYCCDSARNHSAFDFIQQTFNDKTVTDQEKLKLKDSVLKNLEKLMEIDPVRATKLIIMTLRISIRDTLGYLDGDKDKLVLSFLRIVFELYGDFLDSPEDIPELETEIFERYIELLSKFSTSDEVVAFLNSNNGYRTEVAMSICRRIGVHDAIVLLLEKTGNVQSAFELALQGLRLKLSHLVLCYDDDNCTTVTDNLGKHLGNIVSLLCRHSSNLETSVRESLWFSLVDVLVETLEQVRTKKSATGEPEFRGTDDATMSKSVGKTSSDVGNCTYADAGSVEAVKLSIQRIVNAMILHISFDKVVEHVLIVTGSDSDSCAGCFGNVRDLVVGIIDSCRYEREIVMACSRVVASDVHGSIAMLAANTSCGVAPRSNLCSACCLPLSPGSSTVLFTDSNEIICFRCGHAFHIICLRQTSSGGLLVRPSDATSAAEQPTKWRCLTCADPRTGWRNKVLGTPRIRRDSASSMSTDVSSSSVKASQCAEFDENCLAAAKQLYKERQTSSRFKMLTHLKYQFVEEGQGTSKPISTSVKRFGIGRSQNLLHSERFILKLSPPPPPLY